MSGYQSAKLQPQSAYDANRALDALEDIFGSDKFSNMMNGMMKTLNPFQGGLDKIAKQIFPKIIGGMFKMIPAMALMEPLTGFMEGLMVFMEPLSPILEAFGTVLGSSLLPLTTWLADKLILLLPYFQDLAVWIDKVTTAITRWVDALTGPNLEIMHTFVERNRSLQGTRSDPLSWWQDFQEWRSGVFD